jgi:serine protease Do
MEKKFAMRGKTMLAIFLVAAFGALIALFVYTRIIEKSGISSVKSIDTTAQTFPAVLTSYPVQEGLVDFTYAAEQTVHTVVHVKTKQTITYPGNSNNPLYDFFYGDVNRQPREQTGYGSGVIISADGYIITNNHVIEDADNIEVTLNNNKKYTAEVIGRDPTTDIALLKIKENNLPFLKYGDSDNLKIGEWVLAVGNPFNLTSSVTAGIVSAKGRNLDFQGGGQGIESFIQTDAALNPGNSGGALVNTNAELVGITSAIYSPTMSYSGNSFAIPVNIVKKVVNDLRQFGEVQRAIIGVNIQDVSADLVKEKNLKLNDVQGVYVGGIIDGGAAEEAGLKENDVIIKVDETVVASSSELQEQVSRHRPGDKVNITYIRDGKEKTIPIVLKNLDGNTNIVAVGSGSGSGTVFGSRIEPLNSQDKSNYNLDSGVKVTEVGAGKLRDIGIMKGSIITAVNGKKVSNAADIRDVTTNEKALYSIEGIQSNGTKFNFQFRN